MSDRYARPLLGVVCLVLATACFAALDSTFKYLSASLSVLVSVWFRYAFQAMVTAGVALPLRGRAVLRTAHPGLHALRGMLLLMVSVMGIISLSYMPLAEFTAIVMLTPLVVTLLAAVFLGERVGLLRWLLVLGGFVGAMLVVQPGHSPLGWVLLLPLATVTTYAVFQILTSRLARTEDALTLHLYTGVTGAVLLSVVVPFVWQPIHEPRLWALLCLVGALGTVGHFLLIQAFARAPASTLAPYLYTQIGFAMLAGWLVFAQVPGSLALGGIGLIVVCGATAAWLAARAPRTAPTQP